MVVIISAGVILRYVFGAPVLGLNEIIQLTAVALVMAALPYCTEANGHVGVDVFASMMNISASLPPSSRATPLPRARRCGVT